MKLDWPEAAAAIDLAPGSVHVWAVSLAEPGDAGRDLQRALSADERQRAARFKLDDARRRFVTTRAALRTILGHHLAAEPQDVPLVYAHNGKPQLAAGDLHFNVAHSGQLALVAVATGCAVGVDVERARTVRQRDEIARRYFASAEVDAVLGADETQRTAAFLRCWTRKEAILKAIGAGLGYPLDAFSVPIGIEAEAWVELSKHGAFAAARCWLKEVDPCADYTAAVATLGEARRPVCRTFRS